jgi:hypothetical protein
LPKIDIKNRSGEFTISTNNIVGGFYRIRWGVFPLKSFKRKTNTVRVFSAT